MLKQVIVIWTHILNIDVNGEKNWIFVKNDLCFKRSHAQQGWSITTCCKNEAAARSDFESCATVCQLAVKTLHRDDQQFFRGKMRTDEKWKKNVKYTFKKRSELCIIIMRVIAQSFNYMAKHYTWINKMYLEYDLIRILFDP